MYSNVKLNGSFEYFPANYVQIIAMENKHHKHLHLIADDSIKLARFSGSFVKQIFFLEKLSC